MPRIVFSPNKQKEFIEQVILKTNLNIPTLANILQISPRTLRDWKREKYLGEKTKLETLSKISHIPLPPIKEIKEDYWSAKQYAKQGALTRIKIYGPPGTPEGRRKGGINSQKKRNNNPTYYKSLGCIVKNQFKFPQKTNLFAEFIGIMLGDGNINNISKQITITLNSKADKNYIPYVIKLIQHLFGHKPSTYKKKGANAIVIYLTGANLIQILIQNGTQIGNKTKLQINVPNWILINNNFSKWCLRGLIDTDGGIFQHIYRINNKQYSYFKLNFTNTSQPLLQFAYNTLKQNGFHPKYSQNKRVWLYSELEVKRYIKIIGSSNPRLLTKIQPL